MKGERKGCGGGRGRTLDLTHPCAMLTLYGEQGEGTEPRCRFQVCYKGLWPQPHLSSGHSFLLALEWGQGREHQRDAKLCLCYL